MLQIELNFTFFLDHIYHVLSKGVSKIGRGGTIAISSWEYATFRNTAMKKWAINDNLLEL